MNPLPIIGIALVLLAFTFWLSGSVLVTLGAGALWSAAWYFAQPRGWWPWGLPNHIYEGEL